VSAEDWFGNITAVVTANGYKVSANGYNTACGYNAGSDLSEHNSCNHARLTQQRMKSHHHSVWLTRFQRNCADFVALRNIS
jgi:hypothetical protein